MNVRNCAYSLPRPFKVTDTKSSSSIGAQIEPREFATPLTFMEYSFMLSLFLYTLCNSCLSCIFRAVVLVLYNFTNVSHASFDIFASYICTIIESEILTDNQYITFLAFSCHSLKVFKSAPVGAAQVVLFKFLTDNI